MRFIYVLLNALLLVIGLNMTTSTPIPVPIPIKVSTHSIQCQGNQTCDECIHFISTIQNSSQTINKTITAFLEDIKLVCSNISFPGAYECVRVIDRIEQIDNIIFNHTDPRVVCHTLHLCQ
tara:strand:+ start:632 stop:994 length:363 start_codon:yes stop_codon:yes gene_type:complete